MSQRNSVYEDYRRRREMDRWRKRLPRLLVVSSALIVVVAIVGFALTQLQERAAHPVAQVTLAATATPVVVAAVLPSATVAPTATPIAATATPMLPPTSTMEPTQLPASATAQVVKAFDVPALQRLMLGLINNDRQANGLSPVEWDDSAAQAATAHAEDMATQGYFSHWDTKGWGPDVRYGMAGGTDVIRENVAAQWRRYDDGRPAPIDDWSEVIREAQAGLMNSPGHRANILDPHHTHVGIGIAYNAQTGETRIAQEFINRYITLAPATQQNGAMLLNGALVNGASTLLINVAYEPLPKPLTPDDLNNHMPRSYQSPAENIAVVRPDMQGNDRFTARVPLGQNGAGLYHIRIWVNVNGEQVPAASVIIETDKP